MNDPENISFQIDLSHLDTNYKGGICGVYSKGVGHANESFYMSRWDNNPSIINIDPTQPSSVRLPYDSRKSPIRINKKIAYVEKELGGSYLSTVGSASSRDNILIFTSYWYNYSDGYTVFNLHRFRIWEGNRLIRDFRAAEKDGVACIHDIITDQYIFPTGLTFEYHEE